MFAASFFLEFNSNNSSFFIKIGKMSAVIKVSSLGIRILDFKDTE